MSVVTIRMLVMIAVAMSGGLAAARAARRYHRKVDKALAGHAGDIVALEQRVKEGDEISVVGQILASADPKRFDFAGHVSDAGALVMYRWSSQHQSLLTVGEFWLFDDTGVVKIKMPDSAAQFELLGSGFVANTVEEQVMSLHEGDLLFVKGRVTMSGELDKPVHPNVASGGYRDGPQRYLTIGAPSSGRMIASTNSRFHGAMVSTQNSKRIPRR
jgi:hypothetical protein